jgi:hypothetical protein
MYRESALKCLGPVILHLLKKIPAFIGSLDSLPCSPKLVLLPCPEPLQKCHTRIPYFTTSTLILSYYLHLDHPSHHFHSGFQAVNIYAFSYSHSCYTSNLSHILHLITNAFYYEEQKSLYSHYVAFTILKRVVLLESYFDAYSSNV